MRAGGRWGARHDSAHGRAGRAAGEIERSVGPRRAEHAPRERLAGHARDVVPVDAQEDVAGEDLRAEVRGAARDERVDDDVERRPVERVVDQHLAPLEDDADAGQAVGLGRARAHGRCPM